MRLFQAPMLRKQLENWSRNHRFLRGQPMAMYDTWSVGILFRASSNVGTVMAASARSTKKLNAAVERQNALFAAQRRVLRAQASIYAGIAVGIGAMAATGVEGAARLALAMTTVHNATAATREQMKSLTA